MKDKENFNSTKQFAIDQYGRKSDHIYNATLLLTTSKIMKFTVIQLANE